MHIAIDAREWNTTTGRYVRQLVQHLERVDNQHDYSILMQPKDLETWQPSNPRFHKVSCPHKAFTFAEQFSFKKQLKQLKPDLVHFTMVQQPVWYKGRTVTTMNDLTTTRFRNPAKNPLIYSFKQMVYKWVNKKVARKANALVTFTEYVKQDVMSYTSVKPDKINVIPLAAERIEVAPEPVSGLENALFIMYIGRPLPHKNLPRLVEAFKLLKASHPELKLVLAGKKDGNYERIERVVHKQGTPDVIFTDRISDGQLRWLYEHCAAYIFPSLSEGFGLPGLEAMAHGAPVVSSNLTCLPEVYGEGAMYFDPLNIEDMAHKITEVLDTPQLQNLLATKGAVQVAKYSWKRTAEQTLTVYQSVLLKH